MSGVDDCENIHKVKDCREANCVWYSSKDPKCQTKKFGKTAAKKSPTTKSAKKSSPKPKKVKPSEKISRQTPRTPVRPVGLSPNFRVPDLSGYTEEQIRNRYKNLSDNDPKWKELHQLQLLTKWNTDKAIFALQKKLRNMAGKID